jgi:hypothetical protein
VSIGGLAAAVFSCSREPVAAPGVRADAAAPLAGKSTTALAVTSVSPPFGDQGTTVDVHVFGSGFTSGAQATWLLHGVADSHVRTNSTTFVSSSELVANITIANDAQLDFWDVQVALLGGKNGVGSECFEVTSAQILGPGTLGGDVTVRTINDQLQVVGWSNGAAPIAWIYDDALGMVNLGSGRVYGLDPLGTLVVGFADGGSTAWVRQSNDTWSSEALPRLANSSGGNAMAAARATDGTLLVVGWDALPPPKRSVAGANRPVAWRRTAGAWSAPQLYTIPPDATAGSARDVNGQGQVIGEIDASTGIVWENPTTYTRLNGVPNRINASGTLIVGSANNAAVYWWRDPGTHLWHTTGVPLPTIAGPSCTSGMARGINDAGVIVGWSCGSSGKNQATVWLLEFSGAAPVLVGTPAPLPGLGLKNSSAAELSSAANVTEAAPYVVTGSVLSRGSVRLAVRWRLR